MAVLAALTLAAGAAAGPIKPPAVPQRVPFYARMSPADRKVAVHAFDLLWDATETRDWDGVRDRLRLLLASRLVAGPWDAETVAGLAYCYLFAEYIPQFTGPADESLSRVERGRFERWLLTRPDLTRRFVFAISKPDHVGPAVGILHELHSHSAEAVTGYPDLAVAMAIVFDNGRSSPEQRKDTFRWLTSRRIEFAYDISDLPHELARYLVDVPVTRRERQWAHKRYRGEWSLDNVYRDVEYDRDALTHKLPRQISGRSYTLMNLQAYGGTCSDQAYYAAQVGRTLGYPVARIERQGPGITGHCWCLQFSRVNDVFTWREAGGRRFGWVIDPATGRKGSDQSLGFVLRSLESPRARREVAAALTQAALRVRRWVRSETPADARELVALTAPKDRPEGPNRIAPYYTVTRKLEPLWMIRQALEGDPHNAGAWAAVETLGRSGQIAPDDLADLLESLARLAGKRYADVSYFALLAVHASLPPADAERFLEAAHKGLTAEQIDRSPELAAELFMLAGDRLAAQGELTRALQRYQAAIDVDPDYPPVVLRAVQRAVPIAKRTGDAKRFGRVCERIFERTLDPKFGLEVGRIIARGGEAERAARWLRHVWDRSDSEKPGRFESLRLALDLLAQNGEHAAAAEWCLELYEATGHPGDGGRLVELLRAAGKQKAAKRAARRVQENERRRQKRVADNAARRSAQTR